MLIGEGAREHSLGWKLAQSPRIGRLISVPGNPGLESLGETVPEISASDTARISEFAVTRGVDLAIIGPEDPLAKGLVDDLTAAGVAAFGPTRAAARLESSKWFGKEVMAKADVATASAQVFSEEGPAVAALRRQEAPFVVKADGLAAGKGVLVSDQLADAEAWVNRCLSGGLGQAGSRVLIEEHLPGPELSLFAICDGQEPVALAPARDYKRLGDGDEGPNTGGMGSYSPVDLPLGLQKELLEEIVRPVLAVLIDQGTPYMGFLYVGLVLTEDGPKVLEFNVRLGDPEAQAILPRLRSDLLELVLACLNGGIGQLRPEWSDLAAV
ncbi:MAG: phosphoribosylamine--glycine ligase, partial [Acidimicrobiia bacterium]